MDSARNAWNKLSGSETAQAASAMAGVDDTGFACLELTRMQRMYGFGACFIGGLVLSILGGIWFTLGQISLFALFYVLGIVVSLVGTGFLIGFARQLKMMWDPVRRYAAGLFLLCIVLVFVFAFALPIDALVILFAICTFLSYAWYSLSYIPGAQTLFAKLWPF